MCTWLKCLLAMSLLASGSAAWAAGGGGGPMPSPGMDVPRIQTPEQKARAAYDAGVRAVKKAEKLAANPKKSARAPDEFAKARDLFEDAVTENSKMHQAWNSLGYARRKLGAYDAALAAYEQALTLHPGYPEALEYRGEAYLGLSRLEDAKSSYLELFAKNRKLADQLLAAMRNWVQTQRVAATGDAAAIDAFDQWVQERVQIAGQTAALTREGSASSWR